MRREKSFIFSIMTHLCISPELFSQCDDIEARIFQTIFDIDGKRFSTDFYMTPFWHACYSSTSLGYFLQTFGSKSICDIWTVQNLRSDGRWAVITIGLPRLLLTELKIWQKAKLKNVPVRKRKLMQKHVTRVLKHFHLKSAADIGTCNGECLEAKIHSYENSRTAHTHIWERWKSVSNDLNMNSL